MLCILDGVGLNPRSDGNAVALAKKPTLDYLFKSFPNSTLTTFGERVGLPEGQMGNSEVGHLNIGAGRVVEQWLVRINRELKEKTFTHSSNWKNLTDCKGKIHLIGLFSDGGVHSSSKHLYELLDIFNGTNAKVILHLITDGRDTPPQSALPLIKKLSLPKNIEIGTICGRYFAMDRDTRWERVKKSFDAIVEAKGIKSSDPIKQIQESYDKGVTDEFLEPIIVGSYEGVQNDDHALFWNFREDRMRQIVRSLCIKDFNGFPRNFIPFKERALCFTEYDATFDLPVLFHPVDLTKTIGEVVSLAGKTQLRLAETEKYPHVTYFLNGGYEKEYDGENRILIPSPRDVATYDLKPEMSAYSVTESLVRAIKERKYDLIVVNFANGDMVGHSGKLGAAIKAVETVDKCLGDALRALDEVDGGALILADHGNCEQMIHYEDGSPHTAHTTHPVPVILYGKEFAKLQIKDGGALCDIAPTVLQCMNIEKPQEMKGTSLIKK